MITVNGQKIEIIGWALFVVGALLNVVMGIKYGWNHFPNTYPELMFASLVLFLIAAGGTLINLVAICTPSKNKKEISQL